MLPFPWRIILGLAWTCAANAASAPATKPAPISLQKVGEFHLQQGRQGAAAVAYGDFIYVIGGFYVGAVTDIERFDVRTKKCASIFDGVIPRHYHRAVELNGKIYVFGGAGNPSAEHPFEDTVEIYDIATNKLIRGAAMPEARAHMATARLGDKILLCGGVKAKGGRRMNTNETLIYDPAKNTWAKGVPMPTPRETHAVTVGSMVIVPAGFQGTSAVSVVEFFEPQENVWKSLPPLSRTVSAHSLAALDKYLFFFGDYTDLDLVLAYDLSTRQTVPVNAKFEGLRHSAAVVVDKKIYVIGGNTDTGGASSDLIQVFALP